MSLTPYEKEKRKEERRQKKYNEQHKIIDGVLYKKCNHHKEFFPNEDEWMLCTEDYFYKNNLNEIDGLYPYCKECTIEKARINRNDNYSIRKEYDKYYYHKYKDIRLNNSKTWQKENIDQWKKYNKQYQLEHPEKLKEYGLKRANKNHTINKEEWENCKEYFNYKCAYCGISEKEAKQKQGHYFHKEHVNYNGTNDLSNCIPACKSCNSQKWVFTLEEWYNNDNPKFSLERLDKINKWLNKDYKLYYVPYIVIRKKNQDNEKFHYELWLKDDKGDNLECLAVENKRKDLDKYIEQYLNKLQ